MTVSACFLTFFFDIILYIFTLEAFFRAQFNVTGGAVTQLVLAATLATFAETMGHGRLQGECCGFGPK